MLAVWDRKTMWLEERMTTEWVEEMQRPFHRGLLSDGKEFIFYFMCDGKCCVLKNKINCYD